MVGGVPLMNFRETEAVLEIQIAGFPSKPEWCTVAAALSVSWYLQWLPDTTQTLAATKRKRSKPRAG